MDILTILTYIAVILNIIGNYYVNRKNVLGMKLWVLGSILLIIVSCINFSFSQLILFVVTLYFDADGWIKWQKDDNN